MTQIIYPMPEIDSGLYKKLPAEKVKDPRWRRNNIKFSDETILQIRRAYEVDNLPLSKIKLMFPDLSDSYLRKIIKHELRTNLKVR